MVDGMFLLYIFIVLAKVVYGEFTLRRSSARCRLRCSGPLFGVGRGLFLPPKTTRSSVRVLYPPGADDLSGSSLARRRGVVRAE